MMKASLFALIGGASSALAAVRGFNYGSQGQSYDEFSAQFRTAAGLSGANDFNSARLYTMIQHGTTNTPIDAIQAAIETGTTLLLGLWASGPQDAFDNEIAALNSAIQQYGKDFADLVVGISVGSEDLYRISAIGIENDSGVGQSPDVLVDYIGQVRKAIQGTALATKPVGHVDTWNVYVNGSNSAVIPACDFLGLDEYPYYQVTDENSIDNAGALFFQAYDRVNAVAQGKPIWITEAGWPTTGPTSKLAVASVDNAETFWQEVSCELQHRGIDFWWYILADAGASPSFGVSNNGQPLYNLACNASSGFHPSSTNSSSSASHNSTTTGGSATGTASASGGMIATASGSGPSASASAGAGAGTQGGASGSSPAGVTASNTHGGASGPSASAHTTGAASKLEGTIAGLGLAAAVAILFL